MLADKVGDLRATPKHHVRILSIAILDYSTAGSDISPTGTLAGLPTPLGLWAEVEGLGQG